MRPVIPLLAAVLLAGTPAAADDPTNREWLLNPATSSLTLTTTKKGTITETHNFDVLDGAVGPSGAARIGIDLNSLDTGIDIRNVRMRFLFFESFKFPSATLTAQLDPAEFADLQVGGTRTMPLPVTLDLHGVARDVTAPVIVIRLSETSVKVVSTQPVVVLVADHGLSDGLAKLAEAAGGIEILPQALVAFELDFEEAGSNPDLEAARADTERRQVDAATRPLSAEECQNRMVTISATRHIYFTPGSAALVEADSAPVLDEIARFINRCPAVAMQITGHTDSLGSDDYNRALSERRAAAVLSALIARQVDSGRLSAEGFGESSPVADNGTSDGRAKNRRIEFQPRG